MKKLVPVLLLAVLFLAGCYPGGPITITGPSQLPVINSFNASPASISAGESSTLNWTVTGATTVSIDQGIGNVALTGPRAVAPAATTIYTLTASNSAGTTTATTQVMVTGAAATPTPTPTPTTPDLPIVNYFMANPSVIIAGGSTTLGWDVSGTTSVTIDNGVGPVSSAGTAVVSPAASTNYTLTATNAAGWTGITVTVVVGAAPAAGMPDLIIEDIVRSGNTVTYTIKNQGDAAAGPSTSTLLVDGATVANDSVGSLAPGESKTETFAGYTYSCTLPSDSLVVKADTGGTVVESSEANNSYTESWSCLILGPVRTLTLKPDLVVENIWLVGDKIYYEIKNNGGLAAGASTSELYIYPCVTPCSPKATDSVASLAAGESRTEKFGTYNYTGTGWSVGVKVDTTGAVNESDEGNNSLDKPKADL
ncbi:MAG: CARDB domain-containing protein [Dehalococcoidia bacterium]